MKALLALEDGFCLEGESFTGPVETAGGEVIFNTAMTGYQELITDPAHAGHMLCLTWPLVGNYGVNPDDSECGAPLLSALLVKECCKIPSHWQATESLPDFLARHGVPGVEGLDTRALALHLRDKGSMRACLSTSVLDPEALSAMARNIPDMAAGLTAEARAEKPMDASAPFSSSALWAWDAAAPHGGRPLDLALSPNADPSRAWPSDAAHYQPAQSGNRRPRVLVYDFGLKWSLLRALAAHGLNTLIAPPAFGLEQVKALNPDAIFLSGGPGDPAAHGEAIALVSRLAERWPMAGAGLGHQLLALALGGGRAKLKFGHHGANHPVRNLASGKVEISSQNHGFHVLLPDAGSELRATHVSLHDRTLEGFRHALLPIVAVQHDPATASDPEGRGSFFARFRDMALAARSKA